MPLVWACSDCLLASYLLKEMCIPFACFGGILSATRNRCGYVCLVLHSKPLCQVHGSLQFLAHVLLMGVGSDTAWLLVFLLPQCEISGSGRCSLRYA